MSGVVRMSETGRTQACARCDVECPAPVEYHHTEQECESAWEADAMASDGGHGAL